MSLASKKCVWSLLCTQGWKIERLIISIGSGINTAHRLDQSDRQDGQMGFFCSCVSQTSLVVNQPVKQDGKDGRLASHQFLQLCKEPEPKTRKSYGDDGCLFDVDISMADGRWRPGDAATARFKALDATITTGDRPPRTNPLGGKGWGLATLQTGLNLQGFV
ncbi:hypothetical protein B0T13DRAFT_450947 [Neurospora crassa]|nr:hypothetical protein B0T13DRAFT_450947 [Neurospora crassa]